jgi:WD40 repeat protein/energy-coupling factor transporter ATP-binding protein EcfA2
VENKSYDVFVSYSRADGRHAAEIDSVLRGKGLKTFFDRRSLAPGLPWVPALEQAIGASKAAIVLIGPRGFGNTQQYERDLALIRQTQDPAFPVIPVILPGTTTDPPFDFLRVLTWIDFAHASRVSDAPDVLELLLRAVRGVQTSADATRAAICPYRGLDAFREEDSAFFFGRGSADDPESPIGQLVRKVRAQPFVMVVGRSGSGKSSLIFAGLLPALRRERDRFWNVLWLRPGPTPLRALAAAFNPRAEDEGAAEYATKIGNEADKLRTGDPELLAHMIREQLEQAEGKPDRLLLYIDQWEELYTQPGSSSDEEQGARCATDVNRFIDLLLNASRSAPVAVVGTVRADFYDPLIAHQELRALLPTRQILLAPMSCSELERTIIEPAKKVGLAFDPPGLVQQILNEAGEDEGMLPLLQYALKESWALRKGNAITADSYARSGGVREAIRLTAERTFDALSPSDQQAARQLFLRLVTPGEGKEDTRARAAMPVDQAQRKIVEQFAAQRTRLLVTGFDRAARPTVEVAHEALIRTWPRLRSWIDANREKLRARAAILQGKAEWEQNGRREDLLLPAGFQLERARALLAEPGDLTTDDVQDFIEHSLAHEESKQRERERQERRRRRRRIGLAVALAAALLIFVTPVMLIRREKTQLERARYETAAARGHELLYNEDPNHALLFALEFLPNEISGHAIEALVYEALQTPRPKAILSAVAQFPTATFSPDGRLLLIANENAFQVWDTDTITRVVDGYKPQAVYVGQRAVWSHDGRWIIGATDDARTVLFAPCSVPALREYFRECVNQNEDEVRIIGEKGTGTWPSTLSPTGNQLLTGGSGQTPQVWDTSSNPPKSAFVFPGGPANFAIAFNQQGDRLVLGSTDGSIRIHDTANPTERFILRPKTRCGQRAEGDPPAVQVFSVAFNPAKDKGDEVASATLDGCVRLWNVKEKKLLKDLNLKKTGFFFVSFDPSGQRIAMSSDDGLVRVWEPDNPHEPELLLRGHRRATWTVEFSRQTNLLASASFDSVRIWALEPALHASPLSPPRDLFGAVTFVSGDGALTLHTGTRQGVTLDDSRSGQDVVAAAVSKDGNRVLVAKKEKTIKLYDLSASRRPLARFEVPGVEWKAVGFLSNPDYMVGETTNGEFYAWPFFKDRKALSEFAKENLPLDETRKRTELSVPDKCRLGVETTSPPC